MRFEEENKDMLCLQSPGTSLGLVSRKGKLQTDYFTH